MTKDNSRLAAHPAGRVAGLALTAALVALVAGQARAAEDAGWPAAPAAATDLSSALLAGQPYVQLRPRTEVYDPDNGKTEALAATMRIAAGYITAPLYGFSATAEMLAVAPIITSYNSQANGKTGFNTISDPTGINLGQGFLRYQSTAGLDVKAGRQVIALDDQRFFGKSDFRQNYQSIDSILAKIGPFEHASLLAGWGWAVKNSLNNEVPTRVIIGQGSYAPLDALAFDGFAYFYANQSETFYTDAAQTLPLGIQNCGLKPVKGKPYTGCNNQIVGGRVHGQVPIGQAQLSYKFTYAHQSPYDGGAALIDADFLQAAVDILWHGAKFGGEYMLMGANANGTYGFQTPLSTKHLFNGWAEVFQTTPAGGLQTLATSVSLPWGRSTLAAKAYDFRSDFHDQHDGNEVDLSWSYKITAHITGAIEYGVYMPDRYGVHTNLAYAVLNIRY